MNWIQHPVHLENALIKLVPLEYEHFDALKVVAANEQIWEYMSIPLSDPDALEIHFKSCMLKRMTGEQYPFTVIDQPSGNIIGSTLFHSISAPNRKIEIGWTWYDPQFWRTGHNRSCKYLLMQYCFEVLKTIRVQLVTDENNHRSRQAILGIGATMEGILRNERIRSNGQYRNTVMFSIIDQDWPSVKSKLEHRLNAVNV